MSWIKRPLLIYKFLKDFYLFLKNMNSSGVAESSKRFYGGIGWLIACVYIVGWKPDLVETMLYVSAAMIGLETVTNLIRKPYNESPK